MLFILQIDALQEVLEKLRNKEMPLEKKLGWLPSVSKKKLMEKKLHFITDKTIISTNSYFKQILCWFNVVISVWRGRAVRRA